MGDIKYIEYTVKVFNPAGELKASVDIEAPTSFTAARIVCEREEYEAMINKERCNVIAKPVDNWPVEHFPV